MRASSPERARRINAGAELLESGSSVAEAARELAVRFEISERQARRYVERAQLRGLVPVPGPVQLFTVRLPVELVERLREFTKMSGRTLSLVVAQALAEFLGNRRRRRRGGGGARDRA